MFRPSQTLREILHLAWPVLVAQMAVIANGMIDTMMAGRLGAVELAGVGVGMSITISVVISLSGVLLALTPLIAHLNGAGRAAQVGEEVRQALWISLVLALAAVVLLRNPDPFFALSDINPAVEARARAYLDATSLGVPGLFLFRIFSGLSTGIGQPQPVMRINLLVLLLKVPLNLLFIPFMGGAGCALATAILMWLSALLAWGGCARDERYLAFRLFARFSPPHWPAIREFLRLGLPIGATFLVDITAFTFMALFVARFGAETSAAHQIASNLVTLTFQVPLALGNAAAVLVGHALGSGNPQRARKVGLAGLGFACGIGLLLCVALWLSAPLVARLYTNEVLVQQVAVPLVMLAAFYHLTDALQAVAVSILRGYRRTTLPMVIYAVALWGGGLGGGYLLGVTAGMGARGFWLAAIAALAVAGCLVSAYFLRISRPHSALP